MNGNYSSAPQMEREDVIEKYIKEALDSGASREEIEKILIDSGWAKEKIDEAFLRLNKTSYQQAEIPYNQSFQEPYQGVRIPSYGGNVQQSQFQGYPPQAGMNVYRGYAGFWIRSVAVFIDGLLMVIIFGVFRVY